MTFDLMSVIESTSNILIAVFLMAMMTDLFGRHFDRDVGRHAGIVLRALLAAMVIANVGAIYDAAGSPHHTSVFKAVHAFCGLIFVIAMWCYHKRLINLRRFN